jgi:hypothetical protein
MSKHLAGFQRVTACALPPAANSASWLHSNICGAGCRPATRQSYGHTQTHRHTDTQTHRHTDTQTHKCSLHVLDGGHHEEHLARLNVTEGNAIDHKDRLCREFLVCLSGGLVLADVIEEGVCCRSIHLRGRAGASEATPLPARAALERACVHMTRGWLAVSKPSAASQRRAAGRVPPAPALSNPGKTGPGNQDPALQHARAPPPRRRSFWSRACRRAAR